MDIGKKGKKTLDTELKIYYNIKDVRSWRNWHTRKTKDLVSITLVRVQVPPTAPHVKTPLTILVSGVCLFSQVSFCVGFAGFR